MLKVSSLCAGYSEINVLNDVDIAVSAGKFVGLVGSNGAGKTTLLRVLSGLMTATRGCITLEGSEITGLPAHEVVSRGLVQVPEGGRVFAHISVYDNLLLGAYNKKARAGREEKLAEVYELFPRLAERKNQLAYTLSGGERQMLAIGQALMARPKLLMLDEPSLGLAPKVVSEIFALLSKIRTKGISVLLVEQNVRLCLQMADYAYVMENGHIVMQGPGSQLLGNPDVKKAYLGI